MNVVPLGLAAFRSLGHHKLRSALSTLGLVFGVMSLVAMLSIGEGAKREALEQIEQLGTDNLIVRSVAQTEEQRLRAREGLSFGLALDDVERIRRGVPDVRNVAPLGEVEATIADLEGNLRPEIVATTGAYFAAKDLRAAAGRPLCDADEHNLVCVLGADVARALGRRGRVGASLRIEDVVVDVVGVLTERSWQQGRTPALTARNPNQMVFLPLSSRALFGGEGGGGGDVLEPLSEISVQLAGSEAVPAGARVLERTLELSHAGIEDFQIVVPEELLHQAYRTQRMFNAVLAAIAAISLLVGGVGIMNIMLASVSERTREIGIRRAVGASREHIVGQFLCETLALTLTGALLGVAAGALAATIIAALAGWSTVVTAWGALLSTGMALVVGLSAGLYPALHAARLDPIVALRHP